MKKYVLLSEVVKIGKGQTNSNTTGSWRVERPVWNPQTCINCMLCWVSCPDGCIILSKKDRVSGIDYTYCKGCGICAEVCPTKPKSIAMVLESIAQSTKEPELIDNIFPS